MRLKQDFDMNCKRTHFDYISKPLQTLDKTRQFRTLSQSASSKKPLQAKFNTFNSCEKQNTQVNKKRKLQVYRKNLLAEKIEGLNLNIRPFSQHNNKKVQTQNFVIKNKKLKLQKAINKQVVQNQSSDKIKRSQSNIQQKTYSIYQSNKLDRIQENVQKLVKYHQFSVNQQTIQEKRMTQINQHNESLRKSYDQIVKQLKLSEQTIKQKQQIIEQKQTQIDKLININNNLTNDKQILLREIEQIKKSFQIYKTEMGQLKQISTIGQYNIAKPTEISQNCISQSQKKNPTNTALTQEIINNDQNLSGHFDHYSQASIVLTEQQMREKILSLETTLENEQKLCEFLKQQLLSFQQGNKCACRNKQIQKKEVKSNKLQTSNISISFPSNTQSQQQTISKQNDEIKFKSRRYINSINKQKIDSELKQYSFSRKALKSTDKIKKVVGFEQQKSIQNQKVPLSLSIKNKQKKIIAQGQQNTDAMSVLIKRHKTMLQSKTLEISNLKDSLGFRQIDKSLSFYSQNKVEQLKRIRENISLKFQAFKYTFQIFQNQMMLWPSRSASQQDFKGILTQYPFFLDKNSVQAILHHCNTSLNKPLNVDFFCKKIRQFVEDYEQLSQGQQLILENKIFKRWGYVKDQVFDAFRKVQKEQGIVIKEEFCRILSEFKFQEKQVHYLLSQCTALSSEVQYIKYKVYFYEYLAKK